MACAGGVSQLPPRSLTRSPSSPKLFKTDNTPGRASLSSARSGQSGDNRLRTILVKLREAAGSQVPLPVTGAEARYDAARRHSAIAAIRSPSPPTLQRILAAIIFCAPSREIACHFICVPSGLCLGLQFGQHPARDTSDILNGASRCLRPWESPQRQHGVQILF